jgi:hypothetical protein
MHVRVVARADGTLLRFSRATPGRTHDLTAARAHGTVQACLLRQILVPEDRAHRGADATLRTPYYHPSEQPEHYQQFNRDHARLRAPGRTCLRSAHNLPCRCGGPAAPPAAPARQSKPPAPC